jgi:acylglycerol lipase
MKILILAFSLLVGLFLSACSSAPYVAGLRTEVKAVGHTEGHFSGFGGTNLFYQSWAATADPKAVLIMVHGLKDHSDRYAEVAAKLNAEGYAVYAFDNRGHGDSEGQRVWVDSFDDYLNDLDLFYDIVHGLEPNQPVFLFGHSMGGAIVTLYSLKTTKALAGMILSGPALKATDDINGFLKFSTKILGSVTPTLAVFDLKDENFSRDPVVVQALKEDPLVYHKNGPARTAKELLAAMDQIQEHMSEVTTPFLLLHGRKDLLTNPEGSAELFQKSTGKDKAIRFFPNSYHDLLHEPEKQIVTNTMINWLNWHVARLTNTPASAP